MITIKKKYKEDWANSPIRDAYMYKRLQIKKKKKRGVVDIKEACLH